MNTATGTSSRSAPRPSGRSGAPRDIEAVRPLKDGVIADFDVTEKMLGTSSTACASAAMGEPRLVVRVRRASPASSGAPCGSGGDAGVRRAYIIEEPMAAAIGAGLPVHEPTGNMVVDIGGGTTEVAVISLGGIVTSQSSRIGGDELDEAII